MFPILHCCNRECQEEDEANARLDFQGSSASGMACNISLADILNFCFLCCVHVPTPSPKKKKKKEGQFYYSRNPSDNLKKWHCFQVGIRNSLHLSLSARAQHNDCHKNITTCQ